MSKSKILNSAGIGSAALLAGLPAFLTLAPLVAPNGAFADEPTANANAGSPVALSINPALAITAENVTVSATPTVGNTFVTATSTVNVKNTGSSGGYHLIMSSENGALTNGDKAINTFSGYSKTGSEMRNANTSSWGWTLQSVGGTNTTPAENNGGDILNTYYPIPTNSTSWNLAADQATNKYAYLKNTTDYTNTTSGDNIAVGFGFAINANTAAGTYTDTITYTAIPNKDNRTIFDMTNMQDLAIYPDACYNTPTPAVRTGDTPDTAVTESMTSMTGYSVGQMNTDKIPTVTLKDNRPMTGSTRDDLNPDKTKSYTIKKLADGHCWMTESLAIDGIDADTPLVLTSADSNVITDFELEAALPATTTGLANTNTEQRVISGGVNNTMLYNWFAATAGTGTSTMVNESAPSDICPKGWQLPNASGDMSWNKLLRVGQGIYEIATSGNGYSSDKVAWGTYAGIKTASANPLGLQLTGVFWESKLGEPEYGYYWTHTAHASNASYVYVLYYNSGSVHPQDSDGNKGRGRGVRCVSR